MSEFIQAIIDWLDWYMGTELPTDTLQAIGQMASACGQALYWLAERYIEILGEIQ